MRLLLISVATILDATATLAEAPHIDPANDADHFGPPQEELFWTPEQQVAGYRNMDKITWTRAVPAGDKPFPLPEDLRDLSDVVVATRDVPRDRQHRISVRR